MGAGGGEPNVTLTCAAAGVTGAMATVAVEKTAAAARDVIAIRFNMTCLHSCCAAHMSPRLKGITQDMRPAFPADQGIRAPIPPLFGHAPAARIRFRRSAKKSRRPR